MKIAIVHDWLVTNAGAEKVLRAILEVYPNADAFTIVDFLNDKERDEVLFGKKTTTSFIQHLPFARKHFRNYLPLFPKAIESFDLSTYDLIISSSWAFAKGVKRDKHQIHVCYCHTPIRYAWDLYDEYTHNLPWLKKLFVQSTLKYIRRWDVHTLDRVDYFIANSIYVQERINRIYNRKATVIYPPVNLNAFALYEEKEDFYLTASRLVPYKKTKLIVEAFNAMPNKKLIVIGSGEEYDSIKKMAGDNITLLGYQSDEDLISYMQHAKGFVYAAIEDFGIVPIEAMACGTPVIALNDGGTKETIIHNLTGVHFQEQTKESIIEAITYFETLHFNHKRIRDEADKYSSFKKDIFTFINKTVNY